MSPEETAALDVARALIAAGVPVFAARPAVDDDGVWDPAGGTSGCGYWLPSQWEKTVPTANWLDPTAAGFRDKAWRPGWALCAVMGRGVDGLDVDPRNGGADSRRQLEADGVWPTVYGVATTPSGGTHELVASLGVRSRDGLLPGLDVKAGDPDGQGRGFLFIAPTRKMSKTTKTVEAYRWEQPPALDGLADDDSGKALADVIAEVRAGRSTGASEERQDGTPYADQDSRARARIDAYIAAALKGLADDLTAAAKWSPGERDEHKRGWEKLCADVAQRLGQLARAQWNDLDEETAKKVFIEAAPTDEGWTRDHLDAKWKAQHNRGEPAAWPPSLDEDRPQHVEPITLDQAHEVFRKWLGDAYDLAALDAVLAAAAVERLDGDPVWLLVVSGSGNAKTETVSALAGAGAFVTSTVTSEGALLSATSKKEQAKDATGGLLRKIGDRGVLVIKDVTSILSMNRDTRASVLAALREVYDGRWERNVGTDGGRSLTWTGRIVLIGAVTTAYDTAHAVIAAMGDRFALVRVDSNLGRLESGRQALQNVGHEVDMRAELSTAAAGVLAGLDTSRAVLDEDTMTVLLGVANLVTLSRTAVERDYRGDVVEAHQPEAPTRFAKMLGQIVRGALALGLDRALALGIALRVAGDSVPPLRLLVLADVFENPDSRTSEVTKRLQRPRSTVDRALQELHLLGLVVVEEVEDGKGWRYSLSRDVDRTALLQVVTRNVTTPGVRVKKEGLTTDDVAPSPTDIPGDDCECGWQLSPGEHWTSCPHGRAVVSA